MIQILSRRIIQGLCGNLYCSTTGPHNSKFGAWLICLVAVFVSELGRVILPRAVSSSNPKGHNLEATMKIKDSKGTSEMDMGPLIPSTL